MPAAWSRPSRPSCLCSSPSRHSSRRTVRRELLCWNAPWRTSKRPGPSHCSTSNAATSGQPWMRTRPHTSATAHRWPLTPSRSADLGFGTLEGAIELADRSRRGVYILALTSNPEGPQIQHAQTTDGRAVGQVIIDEAAARNAARRKDGATLGPVGVVVGVTIGQTGTDFAALGGSILSPASEPKAVPPRMSRRSSEKRPDSSCHPAVATSCPPDQNRRDCRLLRHGRWVR